MVIGRRGLDKRRRRHDLVTQTLIGLRALRNAIVDEGLKGPDGCVAHRQTHFGFPAAFRVHLNIRQQWLSSAFQPDLHPRARSASANNLRGARRFPARDRRPESRRRHHHLEFVHSAVGRLLPVKYLLRVEEVRPQLQIA
ncbi:hypothetical protein D3C81_1225090 [compost metagenome]